MTISYDDLMYAVLSMAAYEDVPGNLNGTSSGNIGGATYNVGSLVQKSDGFSAVSYNYNGQTVIAYRGTDGNM